jgi:hypothetical protein
VTDLVIDRYNPSPSGDSFYGTGVYKSVDGGQTWADSGGISGRVTAIVADPFDPAAASNQGWGKWEVNPEESQAVRNRMFAIVDRTQLGGNDSIWIDIGAPVPTADASGDPYSGSHALYQDIFIPSGAGTADKDVVLEGSKIGENAPVGANEAITIAGARTEDAVTRTGNTFTITFGGSLVG